MLACVTVGAQTPPPKEPSQNFTPEQIKAGAALFDRNCAPCHGSHMADPESAFDLRTFPHDQHSRFVESVTKGKNNMPPWGGMLKPEDIEALWSYVVAGEKTAGGDKPDSPKAEASKSEGSNAGTSRTDESKADTSGADNSKASKSEDAKSAKKNPDASKDTEHSRPEH